MLKTVRDSEIIKVLQHCTTKGASCGKCPAYVSAERSNCKKYFRGVLDLISIRESEKAALISGQETLQRQIAEKNSETERYKGVIKLLEKDVEDASSDAVKNFAHLLIDKSEKGIIYAMDIPDYVCEWCGKSDVTKTDTCKGAWLEKLDKLESRGYIYYECSNCGSLHKHNTKFCPNCGKTMKKEN